MILWSHVAQSTRHFHYQTHSCIAKQIQFEKRTNKETFKKWKNKKNKMK